LNSKGKGEVGSHQDRARARPLRLDEAEALHLGPPEALNRMGEDDTPEAWNELAEEASELRSPRPLGGGVSQ